MEKTYVTKYLDDGLYCILAPVYYECESKPAWRKCFVGTKSECKAKLADYPESYKATNEENQKHRENKLKEYLFLKESGIKNKYVQEIKEAFGF